jgi:putative sigma-54 modulation protein
MTVKVEINTRNIDLTDRLRDYVTKKVSRLDRYLDILEEAKVDLSYAKAARDANDRQVAQLTIRGKGVLLRAEERTGDLFTSVDAVLDKIYRQIERYKGRRWRKRGNERAVPEAEVEAFADDADLDETIVRRKQFMLTAMDVPEAIEQMNLLGHNLFFVFLNADTNQTNVLYRRRDGTLGLIETEIG